MLHVLDKERPGLIKLLLSYAIYDDPIVASLLSQQANRWQARRR